MVICHGWSQGQTDLTLHLDAGGRRIPLKSPPTSESGPLLLSSFFWWENGVGVSPRAVSHTRSLFPRTHKNRFRSAAAEGHTVTELWRERHSGPCSRRSQSLSSDLEILHAWAWLPYNIASDINSTLSLSLARARAEEERETDRPPINNSAHGKKEKRGSLAHTPVSHK